MLHADHPLAPLQARAALATGWPTLHLATPSESAALGALALVEENVGAVPQAELLEPWDDDDPWRLRIDLPRLDAARWQALHRALPDAVLVPGQPPGAREARDTEAVIADVIAGDLPARAAVDAIGGGLCTPDLATEDPDPAGASLASALVGALAGVSPDLVRHPAETVAFVRHRPTGRRGWRLLVPDAALEGLDGETLAALRRDVVDAIGQVIARRADDTPAIAPDLQWDPRLGFAVLAWRIGDPGPALPGDSVVEPGLAPSLDVLREAVPALLGRVHRLEVQVVPRDPADHDALALALSDEAVPGLDGAVSRWVPARLDGQVLPRLAPCWRLDPSALHEAEDWLAAAADHPGVAAVRLVPVEAVGLEDVDPFLDPAWRVVGRRWVVRWRDGVRDRDRILATVPRDREPVDDLLVEALHRALLSLPGGPPTDGAGPPARLVEDDAGRPGILITLAPEVVDQPVLLAWTLDALTRVDLPGVSAVVDLALPASGPELTFWRAASEAATPTWVSTG